MSQGRGSVEVIIPLIDHHLGVAQHLPQEDGEGPREQAVCGPQGTLHPQGQLLTAVKEEPLGLHLCNNNNNMANVSSCISSHHKQKIYL